MSKFSIIFFLSLLIAFQMTCTAQLLPTRTDTTMTGPRTLAIIVGISKYQNVNDLTYADKDAEMFRSFLQSPAGGNIPDDEIYSLFNEKAVARAIYVDAFNWLKSKNPQKGDRLFIYLAGHGDAINEDECFFLAYDCYNPAGNRNNYLLGGTISLYNVKVRISRQISKGVDVYFIMDACRSNEPIGGFLEQSTSKTIISEKGSEITMLATSAGGSALEATTIGNGNGLFTYYLVDGLMGSADTDNNYIITFEEIQRYVNDNVSSIAQKSFRRKQIPYMSINEYPSKIVNVVDSAYYKKWTTSKMRESSISLREINEYSTMISFHRRVIEIEPKQVRSYIAVADAFMEQNLLDSALLYFKAACELNPNSKTAVLKLGLVYHILGYYEKAIEQAQAAVRLDDSDFEPYYQLACSFTRNGKYAEAVINLQKAFEHGYTDTQKMVNDFNLSPLKNYEAFRNLLDKYIPGWRNN